MCELNRSVRRTVAHILDMHQHLLTVDELKAVLPPRHAATLTHCDTACRKPDLLLLLERAVVTNRVRLVMHSDRPEPTIARALVLEEDYHALSAAEVAALTDHELAQATRALAAALS